MKYGHLGFGTGFGFSGGATEAVGRFFAIIDAHATQYADVDITGENGTSITVDWGDGDSDDYNMTGAAVQATHTYDADAEYAITMTGALYGVTRLVHGGGGFDNRFGVELAYVVGAFPALTYLNPLYCRGELCSVLSKQAITLFNSSYARQDYALGATPGATVNWGNCNLTGKETILLFYAQASTGTLNAATFTSSLLKFWIRAVGATGTLAALDGATAMENLLLRDDANITGDIAAIASMGSLSALQIMLCGEMTCTFDTRISWAKGGTFNLSNCDMSGGDGDIANAANLLYNMLLGHADWDDDGNATVTLTGVASLADINTYALAQGWTASADWIGDVVNAANITVVSA